MTNLEAYVRRVLLHEFLSWRRRRSSTEIVGAVADRSEGDATEAFAQRDLMWRALATLPRRQRSVLILRYYEARPDSEIAGLLGCAEGTVRSLASRAFETLRRDPHLVQEPNASMRREET